MRRLFSFLCSLVLCLSFAVAFLPGTTLAQQSAESRQQGTSYLQRAGLAGFGTTNLKTPGQVLGQIITAILAFVGTIAFVIFLYGGFLWLTARGNTDQVEDAKKYLFNGTIGVAIIILAYAATYYITSQLYEAASTPTQRR